VPRKNKELERELNTLIRENEQIANTMESVSAQLKASTKENVRLCEFINVHVEQISDFETNTRFLNSTT
jgi:predicted nuclease with TOPRIM domain